MNEQITLEEAILTVQNQCSHSFNPQGEIDFDLDGCEYCGISKSDYNELCMNGEPVGTFE